MRYLPIVLLFLLGLSHAAHAAPVSYAIIVGNNAPPEQHETDEHLQPLHYADDDAVRYYQLFSKLGNARLFSVLDTNTQRRYPKLAALSAPPSLDNILQAVASYASSMSADRARGDQPIFYFVFSATGVDGELLCSSAAGEVVFPENGGLSPLLTSNNKFSSLAVISATDMWAVGSASLHGVMSHFDGSSWTDTEHADLYSHFASVSAIASNAVWAVGLDTEGGFQFGNSGSLAAFYNGVQWTVDYSLPNNEYLLGVWAVSATEVWAVGASGTILRHDGTAWSISASGVSQDLHAITKVGDDLWAAGAGGVLLRRIGDSWVVQQSGTTRTIRTLWGNSNTDLWAGGDDGLLLHYRP